VEELIGMDTLSHWSMEYRGGFPPFCMVLTAARPVPVTPNICGRFSEGAAVEIYHAYHHDDPIWNQCLER
jgi:hypothetical protein